MNVDRGGGEIGRLEAWGRPCLRPPPLRELEDTREMQYLCGNVLRLS
jgi:hypothetical protein